MGGLSRMSRAALSKLPCNPHHTWKPIHLGQQVASHDLLIHEPWVQSTRGLPRLRAQ